MSGRKAPTPLPLGAEKPDPPPAPPRAIGDLADRYTEKYGRRLGPSPRDSKLMKLRRWMRDEVLKGRFH